MIRLARSLPTPSPFLWALVFGYFATRLTNLGLLPMVSDEGTYVTWGVRALFATSFDDWLASIEDGKQPLLAWLMPPLLAILEDRLIAGRLVSVGTGLANLLLLATLGRRLFGTLAGWVAGTLYVVSPIALVHDRMALYDSLVATTALLTLLTALWWAERPNARHTVVLGLALGLALLTKLSALFFVALVPVAVGIWRWRALRHWWLLAQSFFLAAACYSVLYLSPIVNNIQDGNFQRYSLTTQEVLQLPVGQWASNARFIVQVATAYLGLPLAAFSAAAAVAIVIRGPRGGRLAVLWAAVPLIAFMFTAKIMYSRYVVFCLVVALLPASWAFVALWRRLWLSAHQNEKLREVALACGAFFCLTLCLPGVVFAYRLLTDPPSAPWLNDRRYITDRFQYVESNYAGYGLAEVVAYLHERASQSPVVVLTRNTTGMPRDGVTAYLQARPQVQVDFIPEQESIERHLLQERGRAYQLAATGAEVYYVLTDAPNGEQERRFKALNPAAQLVLQKSKPGDHSRFQLYRLPWSPVPTDVWLDEPIRFGEHIRLAGYALETRTVHAGEPLRLTLYWETAARLKTDFTVFTHVVDGTGERAGQQDGQPRQGRAPTSRWRPQDLIADTHEIVIRRDAPAGTYELIIGLYNLRTMQRLLITGMGGGDHASMGQIVITKR